MFNGGTATIYVSHLERSMPFYSGVLGLKLVEHFAGEWAQFDAGSGFLVGLHPARAGETVAPATVGAVNVELRVPKAGSIEAVVEALRKAGVAFKGELAVYPHVKIATLFDPDGNEILLIQQA